MPRRETLSKDADTAEVRRLEEHTLFSATPAEVDAWIDANVNDLGGVRRVLKVILKLLLFIIRKKL